MSYFGGKSQHGVYQTLINLVPPHRLYVCGFLGDCGVLRNIKPPEFVQGFDLDATVVSTWRHRHKQRCDQWQFHCRSFIDELGGDFRKLPTQLAVSPGETFLFLDPPYRHNTRTSKTRYKFELTDCDHASMLSAIRSNPFNCMVTHYPDEMYNDFLSTWGFVDYTSLDRAHNPRVTRVYYNYETPKVLHDFRFIGNDYRQREVISRKLKRMKANIKRLPELQRNALMESLNS